MNGWLVTPVTPDDVQITPVDDLVCHQGDECLCGPRVEPVERPDGTIGWITVHHSLDGREYHEADR